MKRIVVIGGGIAGLATAYELRERAARVPGGLEVRLVEAAERLGGNLRTELDAGYRVEWGPNGFLDNVPETLDLVRRLGLEGELCPADAAAARRFLFRNGRLHLLPGGPGSFLACPVLSLGGRLRVLGEPFAAKHPGGDETVYAFARRRIGAEAAHVLVGAMVSGVFAGDARELSLASCFPKMAEMEAEHGGLVKAMLAKQRARGAARRELAKLRARGEDAPEMERPGGPVGPAGRLTSFRGGIQTFTDCARRRPGRRRSRAGAASTAWSGSTGAKARHASGGSAFARRRAARGRRGRARGAGGAGGAAPRAARRRARGDCRRHPLGLPRRARPGLRREGLSRPGAHAGRRSSQRLRLPGAARSLRSRATHPRRAVGLERLSRRARAGGEGPAAGDDRRRARPGGGRPARGRAVAHRRAPICCDDGTRRPSPSATGSSATASASASTPSATRRDWRRSRPASRLFRVCTSPANRISASA